MRRASRSSKVGGAVLRDDLDNLVSSLAFLQQVGLTPIVIHGAGPQLDVELAAAGIEKRLVDGLRVTSPEALSTVRRVTQTENLSLVEALQNIDARATSIVGGVSNPNSSIATGTASSAR
jgi:Acetylglutamate kinase